MYFSNGSEHQWFEENNCFDCLNFRSVENKIPLCKCKDNDNESGFGCIVTDMFLLYQNEMSENMRETLLPKWECPHRLTIEQAKIKGDLILNKENEKLKQEIKNLKDGFMQGSLF